MRVSVITLTTRPERVLITQKCLKQQTYTDFEWIVSAPSHIKLHNLATAHIISDPPKEEGDVWSYNKALNKAITTAQGELIVFYQDSIWIPPDAIEKLVYWYDLKGMCTASVGDIYLGVDKWGKPLMKVWSDPRKREEKEAYECMPEDWEMNFCLAPKSALIEIGGADEALDQYFGMDNISICERLDELGYRFWIDQSLEIKGIEHKRNPEWDRLHAMHGGYDKCKEIWKERGVWPRLPYLK